ncbi:transketolase [Flavobacteriaceae bacterium MAR_2009_75]|nr:transketolase [Flavobacteriaceae bacterium MAR_2009_75]
MELDKIEEKDLRMGIANQVVFAETLEKLAASNKNVMVVTSDSRGSGKLVPFGEKYPNQIVEVGIAEQNLVGVAAGLASAGKKPFAVSPACFITARALEQIKNDVAYSDNPVVLVGISAGVSYGALGTTHHSLHDYAVLRAINNISILAPADNFETEQAVHYAAAADKPIYIRLGKKPMPFLNEVDAKFEFGKGRTVREGKDLVFIATGETVYPALSAANELEEKHGIKSTVVSMHTIKPLDTELLDDLAAYGVPIVTVEEHMVNGGLGEACASHLMQKRHHVPFVMVGIPDEYTVTGSQVEIFNYYGISKDGLYCLGKEMLSN